MGNSTSAPLLSAVDAYIAAPTGDNRDKLMAVADEYRESWIIAQASGQSPSKKMKVDRRNPPTTYDRKLGVVRVVDGILVALALQERTSAREGQSWWTLSWRAKYSPDGPNRRFYFTHDGCWMIPATVALEMMDEMASRGGLDERYFDHHRRPRFQTWVSTEVTPAERAEALTKLTGPDEDWGADPFLVINFDPNDRWKKVLIVNPETGTATFRSITEDPDYMPRKVLRPGEGWWLDNSMMDANVQQMRVFHSNLRDHLTR